MPIALNFLRPGLQGWLQRTPNLFRVTWFWSKLQHTFVFCSLCYKERFLHSSRSRSARTISASRTAQTPISKFFLFYVEFFFSQEFVSRLCLQHSSYISTNHSSSNFPLDHERQMVRFVLEQIFFPSCPRLVSEKQTNFSCTSSFACSWNACILFIFMNCLFPSYRIIYITNNSKTYIQLYRFHLDFLAIFDAAERLFRTYIWQHLFLNNPKIEFPVDTWRKVTNKWL